MNISNPSFVLGYNIDNNTNIIKDPVFRSQGISDSDKADKVRSLVLTVQKTVKSDEIIFNKFYSKFINQDFDDNSSETFDSLSDRENASDNRSACSRTFSEFSKKRKRKNKNRKSGNNVSVSSAIDSVINSVSNETQSNFVSKGENNPNGTQKQFVRKRRRSSLSDEERSTLSVRSLPKKTGESRKSPKKTSYVNVGTRLPWSDSSLWTTISRSHGNTLPRCKPELSIKAVQSSDREACKASLSPSPSISNCWLSNFVKSSIHCAMDFGLDIHDNGDRFHLLSVSEAVERTSKSTNSGLPFKIQKKDIKVQRWVKKGIRNLFERPHFSKFIMLFSQSLDMSQKGTMQALYEMPCLIYRRFQIGRNEDGSEQKIKVRQVWCVPYFVVALEAIFFYQIISYLKIESVENSDFPYSIAQNNKLLSKRICLIKKIRKPSLDGKYYFFSLDYSKFDRTIPIWYVDIFYAIMQLKLRDMSKHENHVYDMVRIFTKYTPFVSDGRYHIKKRGISSGLLITNFFDTMFNITLLRIVETLFFECETYSDHLLSSDYNFLKEETRRVRDVGSSISSWHFRPLVMGDDALAYWCDRMIVLLRKVCFFLGMKVTTKNISNSVDSDVFYLGRYWDSDNVPYQTDEYISDHITFRTKFYKEEELEFSLEDLNVMRVLSICLPLRNGRDYLERVFKDWKPLIDFYLKRKDLHLITGMFYEGEKLVKHEDVLARGPLDF